MVVKYPENVVSKFVSVVLTSVFNVPKYVLKVVRYPAMVVFCAVKLVTSVVKVVT